MSFEAVKREIVAWDNTKLRKLQALVATLRILRDDPTFTETMLRRIDDRSPERWVTPKEFERRLGLGIT